MIRQQVCREGREKYGWEMPTMKLARILHRDNPIIFHSVEDARDVLRAIEGKHLGGNQKRDKTKKVVPDRPVNPYKLPSSDEIRWEPYVIDAKRVLILSDIHIPYHSVQAITACFDFAKAENPDAIILNGDTIDFYQLSRFMKDPRARSFAGELAAFKEFFASLIDAFPNAKVYYKLGNHCERYQHFLLQKAHELLDVDEFDFTNIIRARAQGIEVIGDKRIMKLGALNVLHGHEFGGSIFSPVNIARGLFLRGKVSAMQGHHHQTSEHTETNMNGEITTTYSVGCLCELHPAYLPINKWNHGFAMVDIDGMNAHVRNFRIHKGEVL